MTKCLRFVFAVCVATTLHVTASAQSLSINTTGATADPSAILDVTSTTKGMLIPRMDKTQKNAIATPANGLLVYQTGPDSIGFHYYDLPNTVWVYINNNGFATDTTAWKLNGNNNVTDTSFLGSINNKALKFRVYDTTAGIVDSTSGNTGLGYKSLRVNTGAGFYANTAMGFGAGQALSSGVSNTAMGRHALALTGVSPQNVAIGDSAMGRATSIGGTTAVGFQALKQINGVGFYTYNTAVGYLSQSGPTGTINGPFSYYNTSVGGYAMADNMAGYDNVAIGVSALRFNDSSAANTAVGINAMAYHKRSGFNSNVAVGSFALENDSIGFWNTAIGAEAMQNAKNGSVNTAVGFRSMRAHKVGGENTAVGVGSMEADSSGTQNTAVGRSALFLNKAGTRNTVVGAEAGVFNNDLQTNPLQGSENTYVGFNTGRTANIGRKNAVLGAYALEGSGAYGDQPTLDAYSRNSVVGDSAALRTFGNDNVAMGFQALNANAGGSQHVAVGSRALKSTTATYPNTAIGYSSLDSNTTGGANTAVGSYSLTANKTGINNVAVGNAAMFQSTLGSNNTAVGNDAGRLIRANQNTAIGSAALRNDSTGTDNVAIGYQSSFSNDTAANTTAIGTSALYLNKHDNNFAIGYQAGLYSDFSPVANPQTRATHVGTESGKGYWVGPKSTSLGYHSLFNFYYDAGTNTNFLYGSSIGRNTAIGDSAMGITYGPSNVAVGTEALSRANNAGRNVAIGDSAMGDAFQVYDNVALGYKSLNNASRTLATATGNTATGAYSLNQLTTAIWNTANGYFAMESDTSGSENTAMGTSALRSNTSGIRNVGVGINSGFSVTSSNNTFLGSYAGEGAVGFSTGSSNTGVGLNALSDIRSGSSNTAVGRDALARDTSGNWNVAIGQNAMLNNLASDFNTAVGYNSLLMHKRVGFTYNTGLGSFALEQDSSGYYNTGIGTSTFRSNKTGIVNTGIGINAGYYQKESNNTFVGGFSGVGERLPGSNYAVDTGNANTGMGAYSLYRIANGSNNVALGYSAMYSDSTGDLNTAVGNGALYSNTGSHTNQAFGWNALYTYNGTTNGYNNAFGDRAAEGLSSGTQNVVMGSMAFLSHTSGSRNTAIGHYAMGGGASGSFNTAVGDDALALTTGDGNTALGITAGNLNTTGTYNTFIGNNADATLNNLTNATAIGANAIVAASNSMVLGASGTNVGINEFSPNARLHIVRSGTSGGTYHGSSSAIIEDNTSSYLQFSNPNANETGFLSGNVSTTIRSALIFRADSSLVLRSGGNFTRMNIDNNGYIGVGTTAPTPLTQFHIYEPLSANVNLRVASVSGSFEPGLELTKGSGGADWKIFNSTGNLFTLTRATDDFVGAPTDYYEWGVSAYRPAIDITNSLGLSTQRWTTVYASVGAINTSDARDKENISDLNYGLNEIMKLRPVSYTWKENPQWGKKIGFIAQEVQPILGEVVQVGDLKSKTPSKDADGASAKPASDKLGIYYSDIIPVTVKAIQEQQQTIQTQQKQIDDLKKKNEQLEKDMQAIKAKLGINN